MSEHLFDGAAHDNRDSGPLLAGEPWAELQVNIQRLALKSVAEALLGASPSEPAEVVVDAPTSLVGGVVNLLGEVFNRLPDSLSVAEVCLVLDRIDVALRGHVSSPLVDAPGPESPEALESIVGEASGAVDDPSVSAPDAPSGVQS